MGLSSFVHISEPVKPEVSRKVILHLSYRNSQCFLVKVWGRWSVWPDDL